MTDREMLEFAAKAYGFGDPEGNFIWTESEYPRGSKTNGALWNYMGWCDTAQLWNPLTDDGDALRLAMALGLVVDTYGLASISGSRLRAGHNDWVYGDPGDEFDEDEATRRSIAMAAARIGKEMK